MFVLTSLLEIDEKTQWMAQNTDLLLHFGYFVNFYLNTVRFALEKVKKED